MLCKRYCWIGQNCSLSLRWAAHGLMQHVWFGQEFKLMQTIYSDFCNVNFIKLPEGTICSSRLCLVSLHPSCKTCFFLALVRSALLCLLHRSPELSVGGNENEAQAECAWVSWCFLEWALTGSSHLGKLLTTASLFLRKHCSNLLPWDMFCKSALLPKHE